MAVFAGTLTFTPTSAWAGDKIAITMNIASFVQDGTPGATFYANFALPDGWSLDPTTLPPNIISGVNGWDVSSTLMGTSAANKVRTFYAIANQSWDVSGTSDFRCNISEYLIGSAYPAHSNTIYPTVSAIISKPYSPDVSIDPITVKTVQVGGTLSFQCIYTDGAATGVPGTFVPTWESLEILGENYVGSSNKTEPVSLSNDIGWTLVAPDFGLWRGWTLSSYRGSGSPVVSFRFLSVGTSRIKITGRHRYDHPSGSTKSVGLLESVDVVVTSAPVVVPTPTAPNALTATKTGTSSIALAWSDNSDNENGFYIYRRTGAADPWVNIATVGVNVESFTNVGLETNTLYRYCVSAFNSLAATPESAKSAEASATTDPAPTVPDDPTLLTATAQSSRSVKLSWTDNASDEDGFHILRSPATGGPYSQIGSVSEDVTTFIDTDVSPQTTLYYVVRAFNDAGNSANTNEATATTPEDPSNILDATANFSLSPGARVSMRQVAGRMFVYSDLDRPKVFVNRRWFEQGVKPQLTAAATSAVAGGALTGTFSAYICLYRSDDFTRSVPGPASTPLALTAQKIKVDPPSSGGKVTVRDIGYDQNGTQIDGADFWEIYLTETGTSDGAYMVARLPITTTTWTSSATLAKDGTTDPINDGVRRPMETNFESLIPPACAYSEFFNNRVVLFGEKTIDAPVNAKLTITNAQTYFTVSGMSLTDNLYHKELYLNRRATGWFVVDVESATKAHIRHSDPDINSKGFNGTTGTYSIFAFAGKPGRFYASAYFSGEAAGGITFSPETFPPLTIFENELDPDDNQDPNGCISSRDSLFLFKPGKAFRIIGGAEPDFPLYGVTPISRGSGLLATNTVCRDRDDNIYFLSDQGPHRARQTVIEKIGQSSRAAWLFSKLFDISSASSAVGMWFSREDQFIVFGLNRLGSAGNRDGFIYDSRTNLVCPFTTPTRITACTQTQRDDGAYQVIIGDEIGRIGTFLTSGQWRDNRDFTVESPTWAEQGISCYVQSGLLQDGRYISPQWWIPKFRAVPDGSPFYYTIGFDAKVRSDDPSQYTADFERTLRSDKTSRVYSKAKQMEAAVLRASFDTVKDSRIEFNQLEMVFNSHGAV